MKNRRRHNMRTIMKKGIVYVIALFMCVDMMNFPNDKVRAEETSAEPKITENSELIDRSDRSLRSTPDSLNIADGFIEINETGYRQGAILTPDVEWNTYAGPYGISGTSSAGYNVTIISGTHDIAINNLSMRDVTNLTNFCPFSIRNGSTVNLALQGINKFDAGPYTGRDNGSAGIEVSSGNTLSISGNGSLEVNGGCAAAGIGGSALQNSGDITIMSGNIKAYGGSSTHGGIGGLLGAAAIGGGAGGSHNNITIKGSASVEAIGIRGGSAIGTGGLLKDVTDANPNIVITENAKVKAILGSRDPGDYGAGATIGGGTKAKGGNIEISGNAEVVGLPECDGSGAIIGGGQQAQYLTETNIIIKDNANVKAIANGVVTAIGNGQDSTTNGSVTIEGAPTIFAYTYGKTATNLNVEDKSIAATITDTSSSATIKGYFNFMDCVAANGKDTYLKLEGVDGNEYEIEFTGGNIDYFSDFILISPSNGIALKSDSDTTFTSTQAGLKNTYAVAYKKNSTTVKEVHVAQNKATVDPSIEPDAGKQIVGWFTDSALNNSWNFDTPVSSNMDLYMKQNDVFNVAFEPNNATTIEARKIVEGAKIVEPVVTKSGYILDGWYTDDIFTSKWNFSADTVSENMTLYAKWTAKTWNVNFDTAGGSSISSTTAKTDEKIKEPTSPTKTGYTFVGWYKESACLNSWDFTTDIISGDTTLFAKWSINKYDVLFEENGGSAQTDLKLDYMSKVSQPTSITKTGYTLDGWYKESTFLNPWNFATDKISGNTTLYAKWRINQYDVTFEENGGSAQTDLKLDYMSKVSEPTSITRIGYNFAGWFKDSTCLNPWDFTTEKISGNTTLYAKWNANEYNVKFETDKGVLSSSNKQVTYDQKYGSLLVPTDANAIFGGWFTEKYGKGIKRNESDIVKLQADETLYAFWLNDFYEEEKGNIKFEEGQDDRYSLKVKEEDQEIVQSKDNLQSVYDIYFLFNDNRVSMNNTKMVITLKLKAKEQGFKYYKVAYINNDGAIVEEYVPVLSTSKDEISFEVNHLSIYAVYAWNDLKTGDIDQIKPDSSKAGANNPKTGDSTNKNTFMYLTIISGILILIGSKKKMKKQQ